MSIIQGSILCISVGALALLILVCGAVLKGIMRITDERDEVERERWREIE